MIRVYSKLERVNMILVAATDIGFGFGLYMWVGGRGVNTCVRERERKSKWMERQGDGKLCLNSLGTNNMHLQIHMVFLHECIVLLA